ncbi:TlpA family protein disulfide reductase [Terrabacter terrigena]|uniref:TlpA family protein disulfide reductase n=1 Tax=Terrabacter terrigena TaxID=574718 RepID=A0ABW3MYJ3_9MICO
MPTDALVLAPVILACVLVASAVGKVRSPSASVQAFRDLRVPAPLSGRFVVAALPWVELLLAPGLLLVGGAGGVLLAAVAFLLFAAYLVLVTRALGFDEDVECACFGTFAPGRISGRTVLRNTWLLVLGVAALARSLDGDSVAARLADGRAPWWWLAGAVAAAVTVGLVAGQGGRAADARTSRAYAEAAEDGDYVRARTPALPVTLGDGSATTLRELSAERPQLLVHVSETCGSCVEVIEAVPGWRDRLPAVDIRLVLRAAPGASTLTSVTEPHSVHDPEGFVGETFDMQATPSAVLLGADGMLAGGPVVGSYAVPDLVDGILRELAELHTP